MGGSVNDCIGGLTTDPGWWSLRDFSPRHSSKKKREQIDKKDGFVAIIALRNLESKKFNLNC